jgi:hypothetical protein
VEEVEEAEVVAWVGEVPAEEAGWGEEFEVGSE